MKLIVLAAIAALFCACSSTTPKVEAVDGAGTQTSTPTADAATAQDATGADK